MKVSAYHSSNPSDPDVYMITVIAPPGSRSPRTTGSAVPVGFHAASSAAIRADSRRPTGILRQHRSCASAEAQPLAPRRRNDAPGLEALQGGFSPQPRRVRGKPESRWNWWRRFAWTPGST
jgi:hypothetical protein